MNPQQLKKFVAILFAFVIGGIVFTQVRNCGHHDVLTHLEAKQVLSLNFHQNRLRDPRDLALPVTDKADIESFIAAMKTMKPTHTAIKSLRIRARTPMRLTIDREGKVLYSIQIFRAEQSGEVGIISVSEEGKVLTSPGGTYESQELLQWAETFGKRRGFENITITIQATAPPQLEPEPAVQP